MKRRVGLIVIGLTAGLLLGAFVYPALARKPAGGPVTLTARGWEILDSWPVSRSWSWAVNPVATKPRVAVCVRTVETEIPKGTAPAIPTALEVPPKGTGTEAHSGWAVGTGQWSEGKMVCQFIDFREVELGEAAGKRPLRLLLKLRIGGNVLSVSGKGSVLDGETFVGASEIEPRWAGDELHMLTLYTRAGNTLYAHHVLIVQSDASP